MAIESLISLRRFAGVGLILLFLSFCMGTAVIAQTAPLVTSDFITGLTDSTRTWGRIWNVAVSSKGDLIVVDFENGGIYQFPSDGRSMITLGDSTLLGGWTDMGVAIDANDTLYIDYNWNGGFRKVPYNPTTKSWDLSTGTIWGAGLPALDGYWYNHPDSVSISTNGILVAGIEAPQNSIFTQTINADGTPGTSTLIVEKLKARARSVAMDSVGNIYFYEDGGVPGILYIPAGTTGVSGDKAGSAEAQFTRLDTALNLSGADGVSVDAANNVYISDSNIGVYRIPFESGAPNPAHAVLVTPVWAYAGVGIDAKNGVLYVPTKPTSWGWLWNGSNNVGGLGDIVKVSQTGDLGSAQVGTQGGTGVVAYAFNGSVTPASISFLEAGGNSDFVNTGAGNCATGTSYTSGQNCTVGVALKPQSVGSAAGELAILDASNNSVVSTSLHGVGLGSSLAVSPSAETAVGTGLITPTQLATDASGNVYVADSGQGKVLQYPKGSATPISVGSGLTAPTGVAVDGSGNVFIADSGNIVEVPYAQGGLNVAGQTTIKTGMGSSLDLAVDGLDNIYAADPDNGRVLHIINPGLANGTFSQSETSIIGFTKPTTVAVDSTGNLFVIDGSKLIEVAIDGTQSTLTTELSAANALAVDASGSVYVSASGGLFRIPNINGALSFTDEVPVAADVTNPIGVALDKVGNVYLADGTAKSLDLVSFDGAINFGALNLGDSPTSTASLWNNGNAALLVTGLSDSNSLDFTAVSNSCDFTGVTPVAVGASCTINATMNPGPGEEGPLTGVITVQGNFTNSPVVLSLSGTGAALAATTSSIVVSSTGTVTDVPATVTVAPSSGTGVPTGDVTVTVGAQVVGSGTLSNGSVKLDLMPVPAGSQTFTVAYVGDRAFGRSTASATATVGKGAATFVIPTTPTYVLANANLSNASAGSYYYTYKVKVTSAAGIPTGTVTFMEGKALAISNSTPSPVDADGYATFLTQSLSLNELNNSPQAVTTHTITAVYSGDTNYAGATSTSVTFGVINPSIQFSAAPASLTTTAGTSAKTTLTLTSVLGYGVLQNFTDSVELDCLNLPAHATCSFDTSSVAVTEQAPGTAVVTINTNVSGEVIASNRKSSAWGFATVFGIGLVGLVFGRKAKSNRRMITVICAGFVLLSLVAGMASCADSSTTKTTASATKTPAGTYAISVTAKQITNHNQASLPFTINLTVQ
jgi:sugar lactone lactonase YvrE